MEPTVPGMGLGNMQGLMHSSGGGGRKGFLGLGGRYPTWNSTYDPNTGHTRTTTQGFGTTITTPDGFQMMAPQPRMESFGGLGGYQDPRAGGGLGGPVGNQNPMGGIEGLRDGFMQKSQDRARQAAIEMQNKMSEEAYKRSMEQSRDMRKFGVDKSGLGGFQNMLNQSRGQF